jgi:hypothetical protein
MQATQATVNYAPNSQKEWKVLLAYLETNVNINTRKTAEYFAETNVCASILSKHFAVNPPQLRVKVCPWKQLGINDTIKLIARKYMVPMHTVTSDIHSALSY